MYLERKYLIMIGAAMIAMISIIIWTFFSSTGQRVVIEVNPSAERIAELAIAQYKKIDSYHFFFNKKYSLPTGDIADVVALGEAIRPDRISFSALLPVAEFRSPSYTSTTYQTFIRVGEEVLVSDPMDGTFHLPSEAREPSMLAEEITRPPLDLVFAKLSSSAKDFLLGEFTDGNFQLKHPAWGTIVIDPDYRIKEVILSGNPTSTTYRFAYGRVVAPIELSPARKSGGHWARESLVIDSSTPASYQLWEDWEQNSFGCTRCTDPLADADKDGLSNIFEFLFAGSPNEADTDKNGTNDLDELRAKKSPMTNTPLAAGYLPSLDLLKLQEPGVTEVNGYRLRTNRTTVNLRVPADTLVLEANIVSRATAVPPEYLMFFFEGEFLQNWTAYVGDRNISIPFEKFRGKTGELTIISYSPGQGKSDYTIKELRFVTPAGPVKIRF